MLICFSQLRLVSANPKANFSNALYSHYSDFRPARAKDSLLRAEPRRLVRKLNLSQEKVGVTKAGTQELE